MKGVNEYSNRDSRYDEFSSTMQRDGIPAKNYNEDNWKRWLQDQWAKILARKKN